MRKNYTWRWTFFFVGLLILSLGVTLTIKGKMYGVGSWDILHIGLFQLFGLSIGSWAIITGISILLLYAGVKKQFPKIGTFLNMLCTGLFIDMFNAILPDVHGAIPQLISFIVGIILLGLGAGMYMVADLGAGPRDSFMLLMVEHFGWSITFARTLIEVGIAIIGFMIGGPIGLGSVFMMFGLGPIVQTSYKFCKKLLAFCISDKHISKAV